MVELKLSTRTRKELARLISPSEAARMMGVSPAVVYGLIKEGHLPVFRGFSQAVDPDDVRRVVIKRRRGRPFGKLSKTQ